MIFPDSIFGNVSNGFDVIRNVLTAVFYSFSHIYFFGVSLTVILLTLILRAVVVGFVVKMMKG